MDVEGLDLGVCLMVFGWVCSFVYVIGFGDGCDIYVLIICGWVGVLFCNGRWVFINVLFLNIIEWMLFIYLGFD